MAIETLLILLLRPVGPLALSRRFNGGLGPLCGRFGCLMVMPQRQRINFLQVLFADVDESIDLAQCVNEVAVRDHAFFA